MSTAPAGQRQHFISQSQHAQPPAAKHGQNSEACGRYCAAVDRGDHHHQRTYMVHFSIAGKSPWRRVSHLSKYAGVAEVEAAAAGGRRVAGDLAHCVTASLRHCCVQLIGCALVSRVSVYSLQYSRSCRLYRLYHCTELLTNLYVTQLYHVDSGLVASLTVPIGAARD